MFPFFILFTLFCLKTISDFGYLYFLVLRFLGTLKQHTIQSSVHGDDDLNVEHLQLLLLLFHNLSERGRRSVLTLVTQAITEVAQSRDSQLKAVPLNLARLCLVFDYLLRNYSKAPLYLFEQVNCLCSSQLSILFMPMLLYVYTQLKYYQPNASIQYSKFDPILYVT